MTEFEYDGEYEGKGLWHCILANAFSLSMLPTEGADIRVRPMTAEEVNDMKSQALCVIHSAVGHEGTAKVLSTLLGREIAFNRESVSLRNRETLVVAQLNGRLQEGRVLTKAEVRALPITFYRVEAEFLPETVGRKKVEAEARRKASRELEDGDE